MKKWNVLIVDDEPEMRQLIKLYLNRDQYFCLDAENGLAALDQLKKTHVDIMVVDIMMPFMDGYQLLKEVRENNQVPFIFLSAKGDDLDKVKGLKLGSDPTIWLNLLMQKNLLHESKRS